MIAKESLLIEALLCFFWRCASLQEKVPGDVCMIVHLVHLLTDSLVASMPSHALFDGQERRRGRQQTA